MLQDTPLFRCFNQPIPGELIPAKFQLLLTEPHPLCMMAAEDLQSRLLNETQWDHNFGLSQNQDGTIIGKMFGVLAVRHADGRIGYLSAFSGKLANSNHHPGFVPPVFDSLDEDSFLNEGMREITRINKKIARISISGEMNEEIAVLQQDRKQLSVSLQEQLYDHYHFLNRAGAYMKLRDLFNAASYKNPPAGAGECAGPKLLQYAFIHDLQPLALAEFWWGQSPKSATWKHREFYPCCREKCEPILKHMLKGIDEHP